MGSGSCLGYRHVMMAIPSRMTCSLGFFELRRTCVSRAFQRIDWSTLGDSTLRPWTSRYSFKRLNSSSFEAEDTFRGAKQNAGGFSDPTMEHTRLDSSSFFDRQKFATLALEMAKTYGWTQHAICQAAIRMGLSPAASALCTLPELEKYLIDFLLKRLEQDADRLSGELWSLSFEEKLQRFLMLYISYLSEYNFLWSEVTKQRGVSNFNLYDICSGNGWKIANEVCKLSGEGLDEIVIWYLRRLAISAIFRAAELHLVNDNSLDLRETQLVVADLFKKWSYANSVTGITYASIWSLLSVIPSILDRSSQRRPPF